MPGFDKTGPNGAGPMTGRRMGICGGNVNPENVNQDIETANEDVNINANVGADAAFGRMGRGPCGRGLGRGFGAGRGFAGGGRGQGAGRGFGGGRGLGRGFGRRGF